VTIFLIFQICADCCCWAAPAGRLPGSVVSDSRSDGQGSGSRPFPSCRPPQGAANSYWTPAPALGRTVFITNWSCTTRCRRLIPKELTIIRSSRATIRSSVEPGNSVQRILGNAGHFPCHCSVSCYECRTL